MKKTVLILLMVLLASSLFAYQGNFAVGAEVYWNSENDDFNNTKDSELELKILGSFMLDSFEIAPYFIINNEIEKTATVLTDKYSEWGFGSMFNIHVIKTDYITLGTGIDAGVRFGTWDEEFYAENSIFRFNAKIPIIFDLSLGSIVFRVTQNIGGFNHYSSDFVGTKYTNSTFYLSNGFSPRFGLLLSF